MYDEIDQGINPCRGCEDYDLLSNRCKSNGGCAKFFTNADYIRAMTDEELAEWIYDVTTNALSILQIGSDMPMQSYFGWLSWLKSRR